MTSPRFMMVNDDDSVTPSAFPETPYPASGTNPPGSPPRHFTLSPE